MGVGDMWLKVLRFVAVMLAAITLAMGICHLMQLPARMGWDQYLWVGSTVQGGLYHLFGSLGAIMGLFAILVLFILAYFVREHGRPGFNFALAAALLYASAFTLWWVLVYPANVELAKWVNGPVPADWTEVRLRWECGHAIIALIELAGFAALVLSILADTALPAAIPAGASATAARSKPRVATRKKPRRTTKPRRARK
jgi:hypothetical protein